MRMIEKNIMLSVLDDNWKQHLARMDYLRQGIHLRGYAQKQPKQEYKHEAFELFGQLLEKVKREVVTMLARVRLRSEEEVAAMEAAERAEAQQLRSEEHTSELQSLMRISYAVFCLKKKKHTTTVKIVQINITHTHTQAHNT